MTTLHYPVPSGIRDNRPERGSVADFLREKIREGSALSIVSAYFTIYAFEALKEHLLQIEHLRFLFGEPRFIRTLDPDRSDSIIPSCGQRFRVIVNWQKDMWNLR